MGSSRKIMELASLIMVHTKEIDSYLVAQGLPSPSFEIDAAVEVVLPENLMRSRDVVLDALEGLHAHIAGPLPQLMRLTSPAANVWISIQAINHFKIAESFRLDEQVTFAQIAQRCDLDESDVRRLLRLAIANRIFNEPDKGIVAHNALSRLLAHSTPVRQWTDLVFHEMWPSSTHVVSAMLKWPKSEEPSQTGFALANGTTGGFFDTIQASVERSKRFADAMHFLQSAPQFNVSHLLNNLEWNDKSCPDLIVDVGGSYGSIAIDLLRKYPQMRCIVQDLAEIVKHAKVPADLEDRLSFQEHNFFMRQVIPNADVYFFRSIFHDWSDKYAVQILISLIPALKKGARIILNEICLPEPGILSCYQDQVLRGYDIAMKQNFNGKERDADDWAKLFKVADPCFRLTRIKTPSYSMLSIIEATWDGPTFSDTIPIAAIPGKEHDT